MANWKIEKQFERRLPPDELDHIADALRRAKFWTTPPANSGYHWILEARMNRKYRVLARGSVAESSSVPDERLSAVREAIRIFFNVAGFSHPSDLD